MGFSLKRGAKGEAVSECKRYLIKAGYKLTDSGANKGVFGPKMEAAVADFQEEAHIESTGEIDAKTYDLLKTIGLSDVHLPVKPESEWMDEAKKHSGKKESDPEYNKKMSAKWPIVGLKLGTITKSWAAWCGLFIAVVMSGSGYLWQKNGAAAVNWLKYGQKIEWTKVGIPRGAIIEINHGGQKKCGSSGGNHVTFSDGDCAPQDLVSIVGGKVVFKNVTIRGFGGNQGNQVKVSNYPVHDICGVRWPTKKQDGTDVKAPAPILKSNGCTGGAYKQESTR